jgi:hypothetical protein
LRKAPGHKVDQEELGGRESEYDENNLLVGCFLMADKVIGWRKNDGSPWMCGAFPEPGKGCAQLLSITLGAKQEIVLVRLRLQLIGLAHIIIGYVF